MGYKATIKNKKLHGPAAARHRNNKRCQAVVEEMKTKRWNKNPKQRNNGKWLEQWPESCKINNKKSK